MSEASRRFESIDLLRGIVIVLMAIDHVRNYWAPTQFVAEDVTQSSPELFLTRWITHFCAPVFVFLAGISAFLHGERVQSKSQLARFLASRGLWLILLELLVVNPTWQGGLSFLFVQVIWALGWSMIALSVLIYLPRWLIAVIAIGMILGHNLLDPIQPADWGAWSWLWGMLHAQTFFNVYGQFGVFVSYPLIPWIGVMAAGYLAGVLWRMEASRRNQLLYSIGGCLVLAFIALRLANIYGDPNPWAVQERGAIYTTLSFLNATKYPPSLIFLCMTLGPALLVLPLLDYLRGPVARILLVFGQAPLFFYLIHVPLIHLGAAVFTVLVYGEYFSMFTGFANPWPEAYSHNVGLIYVVWAITLLLLYFPCRWYRDLKQREKKPWMSYL